MTETASSLSWASVKIVEPSVFAMSGSSTPVSWLFVVENVVPAPLPASEAAAGAAVAVEPFAPPVSPGDTEVAVAIPSIGGSGSPCVDA